MPIPLMIQGVNVAGIASNVISFITGSTLGHQRYLALWAINGYDIENSDFLRWLFGQNGNNTQRAGALTVDMLGGHELILQESSRWLTMIGAGLGAGAGVNFINPPIPIPTATIIPIVWVILGAIAVYFSKQKPQASGWFN